MIRANSSPLTARVRARARAAGSTALVLRSACRARAVRWPRAEGRVTQHVLVVSIDGLRPDAIGRFGATTLQRLAREGAATLEARTIVPAKTLPSHTSMLTGVPPAVHGVTWNADRTGEDDAPDSLPVPTVFKVAHDAGFHGGILSNAQFPAAGAGHLALHQAPRHPGSLLAQRTSEDAAAYLLRTAPTCIRAPRRAECWACVGFLGWV